MHDTTERLTIGLDLEDRRHSACVLNAGGDIVAEEVIRNHRGNLAGLAGRYPGAAVAMETGAIPGAIRQPMGLETANGMPPCPQKGTNVQPQCGLVFRRQAKSTLGQPHYPMNRPDGLHHPLAETDSRAILDRFHRDGFAVIRGVLSRDECAALRQLTDEIAERPSVQAASKGWFVVRNPQDEEIAFARLFIREPIYSLVQQILGPECRFCGQNVIRNKPGEAVSNWHVDDCNKLEHPLPPEIPRWPAGARLPLMWLSVQVPLTDILTSEDGPTEIVSGSHYSGRLSPKEDPVFEGRPAEPIFCHAGDIYLFNHQTWHRGRPNTGTRTRYLMQLQYARGDSLAFRCQGAERTPALMKLLEGADPKLVQVMVGPARYV